MGEILTTSPDLPAECGSLASAALPAVPVPAGLKPESPGRKPQPIPREKQSTTPGSPPSAEKWIFTQNPNVQAFTDLLNRAIDKPSEHFQIAGADGGPLEIQWMTRSDESKPLPEGAVIEIEASDPDKTDPDAKNG